jgi:hypothetical protein
VSNYENNDTEKSKTAGLFEDGGAETPVVGTHFNSKSPKTPKSVWLFHILSITGIVIGAGFVVAIFTGNFSVPGSRDVVEVGRTGGIIGSAVSIGLAVLCSLLGRRISVAAVEIAAETGLPPTEAENKAYERQKAKCRVRRILHYVFLGTTVTSFVLSIATGIESNIGEGFMLVHVLSFMIFIPVMIVYLVTKGKLKKMGRHIDG